MSEMIPKPNTVPAEKSQVPEQEPVLDPEKYTVVTELAPDHFSIEKLSEFLSRALDEAPGYPEMADVLKVAMTEHGHQTVITTLSAGFNREATPANKYYLDFALKMAESQTLISQESLKEPDREAVGRLLEFVNQYTEEQIKCVTDITNPEKALVHPERLRMRDACSPFCNIARELRYNSAADLDTDHSKYPEFWRIYDKFIAIYQAVGSVNTSLGTVDHSRIVKR
jgi:hypothetical protein